MRIACREAHCRLFQAFGTGGKAYCGLIMNLASVATCRALSVMSIGLVIEWRGLRCKRMDKGAFGFNILTRLMIRNSLAALRLMPLSGSVASLHLSSPKSVFTRSR
jgi:hypothetical protein